MFSVPLLIVIPLVVALAMNQKFPGRNLFRAIYFAPYVLGVAVVGVLWRYLLDANIGAVNAYLGKLGLPDDTTWLSSVPEAWVALVLVTVWWTLGFNAVIYLAGLQDIPRELYEAATGRRGRPWAQFRYVTLPGLRPVTMFVTLTTIIASANMFGQAFIMTNGAPARETRTAIFYIAETGLQDFQMGEAAAASWILTVALMLPGDGGRSGSSAPGEVSSREARRTVRRPAGADAALRQPAPADAGDVVQVAGRGQPDAAEAGSPNPFTTLRPTSGSSAPRTPRSCAGS